LKPRKVADVGVEEEVTFSPQPQVIEFLKSKIPEGCWPSGVADDVDVVINADWISHKSSSAERVVLHFHGGGYVQLSNKTHRPMTALVSTHSGCKVFSVNYRLAPQNPFPCGLIDAVSAYLHLLTAYKPENIVLMGDSAGGGLALACAMVIRDMGLEEPVAVYLQSPWVDLTHTISKRSLQENAIYDYVIGGPHDHRKGKERLHYYCPNELLLHPYVSPFWGTFHSLPPLFIHGGSAERLYDEIEQLAEKAASQSENAVVFHSYLYHVHVFPFFFAVNRACSGALQNASEWIKTCVTEGKASLVTKFTTFDFKGVPLSERVFKDGQTFFIRLLQ
jgi:acetyl esterase/lipase